MLGDMVDKCLQGGSTKQAEGTERASERAIHVLSRSGMVQGHKTQGAQWGVYIRQGGEGVYNRGRVLGTPGMRRGAGLAQGCRGATGAHSTAGCGTTNFCTAVGAPGRRKLS